MARYWLAPVISRTPFTLGAERISYEDGEAAAELRRMLPGDLSRLLVPFKSRMLAGETDSGVCGAVREPFDLSAPGDIVFDGIRLRLSACGQAMLSRLPDPGETPLTIAALEDALEAEARTDAARLAGSLRRFAERGWAVILLKEEP
ncbi:hypothetical protein [Paenibacillus sp. GYB003]|uniref:hypothetical protein n=1 Tax=Paenibacillus sp. GYB003 TaxID=2994392 RepID=UPI002F9616AF